MRFFKIFLLVAMSVTNILGYEFSARAQEFSNDKASASAAAEDQRLIDAYVVYFDTVSRQRQLAESDGLNQVPGDDVFNPIPGDGFPTDPSDEPYYPDYGNWYPFPTSSRSGLADRLAMEVLFQTLNFYGVSHYVEKKGTQVQFKIAKSVNGYFTKLNNTDIAYAIREFSKYIVAHMCNQPTTENFYRMFSQIPREEIGLRFKYDMALALLGHQLPKEPNSIYRVGGQWAAIDKILNSNKNNQDPELKNLFGMVRTVISFLTNLNKVNCFSLDIRPVPKDEIKKRIVAKNFLEMEKDLNERYEPYKEILNQARREGQATQIEAIKTDLD